MIIRPACNLSVVFTHHKSTLPAQHFVKKYQKNIEKYQNNTHMQFYGQSFKSSCCILKKIFPGH
jgi:hypothetical protein